jgi:hypothetical protein
MISANEQVPHCKRHVQVHRQIECGPIAMDFIVQAERVAGMADFIIWVMPPE